MHFKLSNKVEFFKEIKFRIKFDPNQLRWFFNLFTIISATFKEMQTVPKLSFEQVKMGLYIWKENHKKINGKICQRFYHIMERPFLQIWNYYGNLALKCLHKTHIEVNNHGFIKNVFPQNNILKKKMLSEAVVFDEEKPSEP